MTTKMQSCVGHIKTSIDVDPWAAEMVEKIFTEYDRRFDKVLEIIDKHIEAVERSDGADTYVGRGEIGMAMIIRCEVLALKGGDE